MSSAPRAVRGSTSGISKQRLRGRVWRRATRDVYVLAELERSWRLAGEVALLALPDATLSHCTAARALELPVDTCSVLHVTRPRATAVSKRARVQPHRAALPPGDVLLVRGLRVTAPVRTWLDLAARLELVALVVLGDAVARRVGVDEMQLAVDGAAGRRGVTRAREALLLVDPGAESGAETRTRLMLHEAGFRALMHGVQVRDEAGQWLAAPDLADEDARVAVQYDGLVHLEDDPEQRRSDIDRDELARAAGWQVVVLTARDLRLPHLAIPKVTAAYARATALAPPRGAGRR